jgi:hypothetical protein
MVMVGVIVPILCDGLYYVWYELAIDHLDCSMDAGPPQARTEPKHIAFAEASIPTAWEACPTIKSSRPKCAFEAR